MAWKSSISLNKQNVFSALAQSDDDLVTIPNTICTTNILFIIVSSQFIVVFTFSTIYNILHFRLLYANRSVKFQKPYNNKYFIKIEITPLPVAWKSPSFRTQVPPKPRAAPCRRGASGSAAATPRLRSNASPVSHCCIAFI